LGHTLCALSERAAHTQANDTLAHTKKTNKTLLNGPNLQASSKKSSKNPEKNAATAYDLNDVTIVVSSCDKYAALWPGFFHCLFRFWPSLLTTHQNVPILLIANQKHFVHPRVRVINTGKDRGWSQNMLDTLRQVKTPYVLYM